MPLTDKKIQAIKPAAKEQKLSDGQGLYLLVSPAGGKHWKLKYYYQGTEKKLSLGAYPVVALAKAREKALEARRLLDGGIDPSSYKKEEKAKALIDAQNTFEAVARAWHQKNLNGWEANTAGDILRRLTADIFPAFGHVPIKQVTAQHIIAAIRQVEGRQAHEVARRLKMICGQVFRFAIVEGLTDNNPAITFHNKDALKPYKKSHFAAFDSRELPNFLRKLERNDARLYLHTRLAMKLMLLTFVRTSELIEATWDEIRWDEKVWIIPAARMKMRRDHMVPLAPQALEILQELYRYRHRPEGANWPDYIFPNQTTPRKHMSNNTILFGLGRLEYRGVMTGHGFRSLAMSTIKEKLGYRHEVVDRQLAHAPANKVDAAYDRAAFMAERVEMMGRWADYLDHVAKGVNMAKLNQAA